MAEAECCEALAIFLRADDTDPAITDNRRLLAAARNPSPTRRGGTAAAFGSASRAARRSDLSIRARADTRPSPSALHAPTGPVLCAVLEGGVPGVSARACG